MEGSGEDDKYKKRQALVNEKRMIKKHLDEQEKIEVLPDCMDNLRVRIREVLNEELETYLTRFNTTLSSNNSDDKNEYMNIGDVHFCPGQRSGQGKSEESRVGSCDHVEGPGDTCKYSSLECSVGQHRCIGRSSLTNPTYEAWGNDWIVAGERDTKAIVRRDSESSKTSVKKTSSPHTHLNQPPEATPSGMQLAPPVPKRKGYIPPIASDRECLANALQSNVEDIVGTLIFKDSELPDELIGDGCITEDESFDITHMKNRKDQIRVLLSLIRGRDTHVLKNFVKRIEKHVDKNLADKINVKFEDNKRNLVKKFMCVCCEMKTYVNIKSVSDSLWSIGAINCGLYSEIAHLDKPNGAQNDYWVRLIDSMNNIPDKEQRAKVYDKFVQALDAKQHYSYIAEAIEASIQKNKILACRCKVHCLGIGSFRENTSYDPGSSTRSSFSDGHDSCGKLSETEMKTALETEATVDAPGDLQHTRKGTSFQEPACRDGVERLIKPKRMKRLPTWPDNRRHCLKRQDAVDYEDVIS